MEQQVKGILLQKERVLVLANLKAKLPCKNKKSNKTSKQAGFNKNDNTVQNWLPIQDILEGIEYQDDGTPVAVVRVEPSAFTLLSDREKERRINALFEAIQAIQGDMQIAAVPRPIDLDIYITGLEEKIKESAGRRKAMLKGYTSYVRNITAGAEAMEKRFFVLIPGTKGSEDELLQKTKEFIGELGRAELNAHLCSYQEILDMLFSFFHSAQSAFERAEEIETVTPYVKRKEVN